MSSKEHPDTRHQRKALGRGLSALLESRTAPAAAAPAPAPATQDSPDAGLHRLMLSSIEANPEQPRRRFTSASLEELAASIRQHGLLQPVLVTRHGDGKYRLIAGERRWRAAKLAGLEHIPAIVQESRRDESLEIALIENIQREDLNPMEAAAGFERLSQEFGLTHEEIARRTGKDRATITNYLRLLRLPVEVQQSIAEGKLSTGHAKALLGLPSAHEQQRMAAEVVGQELSVRATERLVTQILAGETKPDKPAKTAKAWDPNIRAALQDMERALGTRVKLSGTAKKGRLIIEYYSPDDLMRLYDAILKQPQDIS